jgi:hydrogenase maturation protein HypF
MADNDLDDRRLIGLCFDDIGYGTDDAFWGGEVLLASYSSFERFAHLENLPLPGGESASRTPWRIAAGYAHALGLPINDLPFLEQVDPQSLQALRRQIDEKQDLPKTSCMANFLDAVAGLIGVRNTATYELQAAIEMERLARPFVSTVKSYPFEIDTAEAGNIIPLRNLFAAVIQDIRSRQPVEIIAARFHKSIAEMAVDVCRQARRSTGLNEVALSGAVWQNQILFDLVRRGLKREGFTLYTHSQVPTNDGGLALGQAVIANCSLGDQEIASPTGYAPVSRNDQPSGEIRV